MLSETDKGQLVVALCKFAIEAKKEGTITHGIKCLGDAVKEIEKLLAAHDLGRQISVEYACGGQEYWDLEPDGTLRIDIPRDQVVVASHQLAAHDISERSSECDIVRTRRQGGNPCPHKEYDHGNKEVQG